MHRVKSLAKASPTLEKSRVADRGWENRLELRRVGLPMGLPVSPALSSNLPGPIFLPLPLQP